jgi:hypothetical protein
LSGVTLFKREKTHYGIYRLSQQVKQMIYNPYLEQLSEMRKLIRRYDSKLDTKGVRIQERKINR